MKIPGLFLTQSQLLVRHLLQNQRHHSISQMNQRRHLGWFSFHRRKPHLVLDEGNDQHQPNAIGTNNRWEKSIITQMNG